MKSRFSKTLSFMLAVIFCISALTVPAYATDTADTENKLVLDGANARSGEPMLIDGLEKAGDTMDYEMEIDHSLYPEAILYAFSYGVPGNATIRVYDENEKLVSGIYLQGYLNDRSANTHFSPKGRCGIKSTESTIKKYKVTVTAETDNVIYAMNVGTRDTMAEHFGGIDNTTAIAKNIPSKAAEGSKTADFAGYQTLLDGEGEWFYYVADGYTYITARASMRTGLAFEVYDAETGTRVYQSRSEDTGKKDNSVSSYSYVGYVQRGLNLEPGRDYFIRFYSTLDTPVTDSSARYYIHIGLPCLTTQDVKYNAQQSFYVPANRTVTFTINVPKDTFLPSTRANAMTAVYFSANSSMENAYVDSCTITTPNGQKVTPLNGRYSHFETPSSINYLTDENHVPLTGNWKVTIRTSKSLYFQFALGGSSEIILGESGNEVTG